MASNFSYLSTDFNRIFANNSLDFNYNKTVSSFKTNGTSKTYNATNGSTTQQNNIDYTYNNTVTNFSSGIQAYYQEFSSNASITIPEFCSEIRYFLVGGGGSGGAGGGDTTGKKGTNGAGGGGGGYQYGTVNVTPGQLISITIGIGGAPVSGGQTTGDSNNGKVGLPGTSTGLTIGSNSYFGLYGTGGDGGHPSSSASPGIGGAGNINAGSNSSGMTGGLSGYTNFINANDFSQYFKPYSTASYGNGGDGTSGGYDPNSNPTGAGGNGYARIYFMA